MKLLVNRSECGHGSLEPVALSQLSCGLHDGDSDSSTTPYQLSLQSSTDPSFRR